MRYPLLCALIAPALTFAQGNDPANSAARVEIAAADLVLSQSAGASSLRGIQATWVQVARENMEESIRRMESAPRPAIGGERAYKASENARAAWAGLKSATDLAIEASEAWTVSKEASSLLVGRVRSNNSSVVKRADVLSPGVERRALAIEASNRLLSAKKERVAAQAVARALEIELNKAEIAHRRLLNESARSSSVDKAMEVDIAFEGVSRIAADAAVAYASAARFAALEMHYAKIMVEAYARLGNESVGQLRGQQGR